MWGGGFVKHAVDTLRQQRQQRKDRHDLHDLQKGGDRLSYKEVTHVDFSHLSPEEIEMTRRNIRKKYRERNRKYWASFFIVFAVLFIVTVFLLPAWVANLFLGGFASLFGH